VAAATSRFRRFDMNTIPIGLVEFVPSIMHHVGQECPESLPGGGVGRWRVGFPPAHVAGNRVSSAAAVLAPGVRMPDPHRMSLELDALETSFDLVAADGDQLMDVFYARLFAAAPAVKPLFAGTDLRRQKGMLLAALVLLRKSLRNLEAIVPNLHALGARHVAYGARPEHYPVVGEVLIASMAQVAGDAWRPEYERAWVAAFEVVAGVMLEGAATAEVDLAA
jgi:hemoglobin-like flavoprotein